MPTQQPQWKCIGHIGDVDPIAHGGAFVYIDETGVYPAEMTWFQPGPDETWDKIGGQTPLEQYRIILERDPTDEWWWDKIPEVAKSCGQTEDEFRAFATDPNPLKRAWVYDSLIAYFGPHEFDSYPTTQTEDQAYEQYAEEMKISLSRE